MHIILLFPILPPPQLPHRLQTFINSKIIHHFSMYLITFPPSELVQSWTCSGFKKNVFLMLHQVHKTADHCCCVSYLCLPFCVSHSSPLSWNFRWALVVGGGDRKRGGVSLAHAAVSLWRGRYRGGRSDRTPGGTTRRERCVPPRSPPRPRPGLGFPGTHGSESGLPTRGGGGCPLPRPIAGGLRRRLNFHPRRCATQTRVLYTPPSPPFPHVACETC